MADVLSVRMDWSQHPGWNRREPYYCARCGMDTVHIPVLVGLRCIGRPDPDGMENRDVPGCGSILPWWHKQLE